MEFSAYKSNQICLTGLRTNKAAHIVFAVWRNSLQQNQLPPQSEPHKLKRGINALNLSVNQKDF